MMAPAPSMYQYRGELRTDEPLSRHTVWGIGGPAKRFYRPADIHDLAEFMTTLPAGEAIFWLGLGMGMKRSIVRLFRPPGPVAQVVRAHA